MSDCTPTLLGTATDADLMRMVRDGDRQAFSVLHQRHASSLLAFVTTIAVDRSLAEDVVQDVFTDVWTDQDRFDADRGPFRAWLRTIAHRRAVDRIRSVEASRRRDVRIGLRDHRAVDHDTDQWDALFSRPQLTRAIRALSAKQRDAVVLRYLAGRTTIELANTLGVSTDTAKTRVRDGLIALRRLLEAPAA